MKSLVVILLLTLGVSAASQAQVAGLDYGHRRQERRIERSSERYEARQAWRPHPGWVVGWTWNRSYYPRWYTPYVVFPGFYWTNVPVGYWQCTAFNGALQAFTGIGPDVNQAAWGALSACGGANYQAFGCYIPTNYCQLRY